MDESDLDSNDAAITRVVGGCRFTEGPAADDQGNLFFSDCPNNRVMVLRPSGEAEVWREPSGRANGLNFDPNGALTACCAQGEAGLRSVVRFEDGGRHEILAAEYEGKRLNSPNDLCFDPEGQIYFNDPRYGNGSVCEQDCIGVYRIDLDGCLTRVIDDAETPNGILMTPEGKTIYLVDNNLQSGGEVYVFSAQGEQLGFIHTPEPSTNCTFGGPEFKTLYITATTSVYSVECTEPGFLAFPKIT